jgi:predicted nuclease of restriction endonuclease-like (RecB) superfamily
MRLFYIKYPKFRTSGKSGKSRTSGKLTWSHYCELLIVSDNLARVFYEQQAGRESWSVRELKRQINSALFQRLALSKDKKGVMALAAKGQLITNAGDLVKDPYVFEFLKIPESKRMTEATLEKRLIDNLQNFLLELGKGFSFVARQFRITLDNKHYRIDLVFYHRILKCFILIDLKAGKVKHGDIGQMNLYLNYFKEEENTAGDNEPIGIIIAADKHEYLVKYATGGLSNKIFVSKYQLYLPDKKLLEQKIREIVESD